MQHILYPWKTKKDLHGSLEMHDASVNKYHKTKKKTKKQKKDLKYSNNMLYSMAKKTNTRRELQKVNNIKPSFKYSRIKRRDSSDYE